jgi:predicted glycosyltransferase
MPEAVCTVLLYAQDNHGLGHINRTLTIVRHILDAHQHAMAVIVTKSPIASIFTVPERCDYIKLPTRRTPPAVKQTAAESVAARERYHAVRRQLLRAAALGLAPELVVVDHEPLGFAGEFRDGLYALKEQCPTTRFVYGMRDIMDDPAHTRTHWRDLGVYEAFETLYDGIVVYGSPHLYDVAQAYDLPPTVQAKLHYCGYVVRDAPSADAAGIRARYGLPPTGPFVVAAVGSGSDGYPVLAATLAALRQLRHHYPGLCAVLVAGPFMPPEHQAALHAQATPTCRVVPQADCFELMVAADAIISMGGYNSVCEALAAARPLVIVPRATHKVEQLLRGQLLARHDLAYCVPPQTLSAETLAAGVHWALGRDQAQHAARLHRLLPAFDGAHRLTEYVTPWLAPR